MLTRTEIAKSPKKSLIGVTYWRPSLSPIPWLLASSCSIVALAPFLLSVIYLIGLPGDHTNRALATIDFDQIFSALKFTLIQASVSALLVGILAPFLAVAMMVYHPRLLMVSASLRVLVFCLPTMVMASGVVLAWGQQGLVNLLLSMSNVHIDLSDLIYSQYAIVGVNVIFSLPFASVIVQRHLASIPINSLSTSRELGLPLRRLLRYVAWPQIRPQIFFMIGLTVLTSLTNFGALSVIGGRGGSVTLELGIYQSIYLDGNWRQGACFALCQTALSASCFAFVMGPQLKSLRRIAAIPASHHIRTDSLLAVLSIPRGMRYFLTSVSVIFDGFIILPLIATMANTFYNYIHAEAAAIGRAVENLGQSIQNSLRFALPVGIISTIIVLSVTTRIARYQARGNHGASLRLLALLLSAAAIPAMVTSFGLIGAMSGIENHFWHHVCIVSLQVVHGLPYLVSFILPVIALKLVPFEAERLLNTAPLRWWAVIEWPTILGLAPIIFSVALSFSLNETAIVAMLSPSDEPTITTSMLQMMGHYQFNEAGLAATVLMTVTAVVLLFSKKVI